MDWNTSSNCDTIEVDVPRSYSNNCFCSIYRRTDHLYIHARVHAHFKAVETLYNIGAIHTVHTVSTNDTNLFTAINNMCIVYCRSKQ